MELYVNDKYPQGYYYVNAAGDIYSAETLLMRDKHSRCDGTYEVVTCSIDVPRQAEGGYETRIINPYGRCVFRFDSNLRIDAILAHKRALVQLVSGDLVKSVDAEEYYDL